MNNSVMSNPQNIEFFLKYRKTIKLGEEINFANVTLNFALPETIVSRSLQNLTFALFIYEHVLAHINFHL